MKNLVLSIIVFFILGLTNLFSQETSILAQALELERNTTEALALYPMEERVAILEATTRPQILVHMHHIRNKTEEDFRSLLEPMPLEVQRSMFNLARYPELIEVLCSDTFKKSAQEIDRILENYPEDLVVEAKNANENHFSVLRELYTIQTEAQQAFYRLLSDYPENIQNAYYALIEMPDVIEILVDNMTLTVLLGDIYQRQPDALMSALDEISLQIAEQRMKDFQEWKNYLKENPEAMAEYKAASEEFSKTRQYDDQYYEFESNIRSERAATIIVHHVYRPYPYWFGRPWWNVYGEWYPYPIWYYSGYYYGPGNVIVFINMPSAHFFHWYLYNYHHFYHYPHFTGHIFRYYYGPRRGTIVHTSVGGWLKEHEGVVSERWLADKNTRAERLAEFGKFKTEYEDVVRGNSAVAVSQEEFIRQNADRFPRLKAVVSEDENLRDLPVRDIDNESRELRQPLRAISTPEERKAEPQRPVIAPRRDQSTPPQVPADRNIERAREYHKQTWERTNPQPPVIRPPQTIRPSTRQPQTPTSPERKTPVQRSGGG